MLEGPRSFFTDLDPKDKNSCRKTALRNLKLQLLTKKWVIIGASSIFHHEWTNILRNDSGLISALNKGIIIPAIRYDFKDISGFFSSKDGYDKSSKSFYEDHTSKIMVWDLDFNSSWFEEKIFEALDRPSSILRRTNSINSTIAKEIKEYLIDSYLGEKEENQFFQRTHLENTAIEFGTHIGKGLIEYGNLIYRMSGARTVDSEGHFPQSNITEVNISGNDEQLSDESIFWDIYAEAVFSNISKAVRISEDRIDNLEFSDILKIREGLLTFGFCDGYDSLLKSVKESVDIDDPEKLILHAEEITNITIKLRSEFSNQLSEDKKWFDSKVRAGAMWQMANGLSILGGPVTGVVMGVVSTLGALPEITAPFSKSLSDQIENRKNWMDRFVNSKLGWNTSHRGAFLQAYKELVTYGLS
jgi:hypothetical protein